MHVIGQSRAKMVLSVAMYNHYKRLNYLLAATKLAMEEEEDEMDLDNIYSDSHNKGKPVDFLYSNMNLSFSSFFF